MAYYILASPSDSDSCHTPLWFRIGSDNAALTQFRFIIDVYVAGAVIPVRLKVLPDASYAGIVDVSRIVRSYVTNYFNPDSTNAPVYMDTDSIIIPYTVKFGEEYLVGSTLTQFLNLSVGNYKSWNNYSLDTVPNGYVFQPGHGYDRNWLTSRDTSAIWIPKNGDAFISYFNTPGDDLILVLTFLDDDGKPFTTGSLGVSTYGLGVSNNLIVVNLSAAAMNAAGWNTAPTPAVRTDAGGYKVRFYRIGTPTVAGPEITVRFMCEPKVKAYPLHFLNRFGGFDTFYFSGPTRSNLEIERKTMQQLPLVNSGSTISEIQSNNVYADTLVVYNTRQTWTRKLSSGWVNDIDHKWLAELLASPTVYFEENGYYYPVIINTSKWAQKFTKLDKVYNLELEIAMGRQVFSQNR